MKIFIVDTLASVLFFTAVATFSELVIAGMEPMQVLLARTIMVPVMVLTGRPYGMWRDRVFMFLRPGTRVSRIATDIIAFIMFQMPIYVATLLVAGAGREEVLAAVSSAIVLMITTSRPFGLFLDLARRLSGLPAT
ncbi:L-alanine exporter AlaE [uncultured Nisaea sp.]|uniref:L-alanine exporter AlaE n=1 Tax=uncultured Nisaea sp. TaxID=538215 RepID=UPI0030EDC37C|tara:strand:+ start:5969 stop:6376 length:408 start_codon:yes stop_codon:yes gene_type:complete